MNKKGYSNYNDRFNDAHTVLATVFLVAALTLIALGVTSYIYYVESSNACNEFGGKLSGQRNCIKEGVSYELETKGMLTFKKQVVRQAVDISEVYRE